MKTRVAIGALILLAAVAAVTPGFAAGPPSRGTQGYLGVDLRDITEDQLAPLKLKETRGAEVISLDHDGPACKAGLLVHDVILQMNGQIVEGEEQLRRMLRETPAGHQVTLLISRDGQQRTITTQLANREDVERQAWEQHYTVPEPPDSSSAYFHAGSGFFKASPPSSPATGALKGSRGLLGTNMIVSAAYTGAKLEVMGPQLAEFFGAQGASGLLVRSVDPQSPASDAGLKAGDVVIKVNSVPVTSGTDWIKTIHENRGKPVNVVVLRDKKEKALTLTPDAKKRSSLEPGMDLEEFFGFGDEAQQTRAILAQLEPMIDQLTGKMAAEVQPSVEAMRNSAEMKQLMDKMHNLTADPQFQRQLEEARRQIQAAAEVMSQQMQFDMPVFHHMD
ncbi:PDZ domain-containing protein [Edaphobacter bradus]|uniref:PDZ domain-containing protein n=1 Tax=Edaphobacter bradus TaxID=2259016 RepID=UPI0021E0ECEE|nr:PDZ domain-containing protein [Edaphobacter bradus]